MKKLLTLILFAIPFISFGQSIPGCGTYTNHATIVLNNVSNQTISDYLIDCGNASVSGIVLNNCSNIHITRCKIQNSKALTGLIYINGGNNIKVDTCFLQVGWRGVYALNTTSNIQVNYNYIYNIIDPNVTASSSDGGGSSIQFNNVNGAGNTMLDNKSYHDVSSSGIGDQYSVYKSTGTATSPIRVCRNQALNGSTNPPGTGYVGAVGGDVAGGWQRIDSNIFVNTGAVGCQVQGTHDVEMSYNTVFLAQTSYTSVGMAFGNYTNPRIASYNITMGYNNVRCIAANGSVFNYWFDPNTAFAPNLWSTNTTSTSLNANILPNPLWPSCSPVVSPPNISYSPSTNVWTVGVQIASLVPTNTGGNVVSYSVSPALPLGVGISSVSGIISGTPTAQTNTAVYTVKAVNSAGQSTMPLTLSVKAAPVPAPSISYSPNSYTFTVGTPIVPFSAANVGGNATSWGISPSLVSGLVFNAGQVSGTPLASSGAVTYTVSASNATGTGTTPLVIQVNPQPPAVPNISYTASTVILSQGINMPTLTPVNNGGVSANWTTDVPLPAGCSINNQTGVIQGVPTTITSTYTVTVKATNATGFSTFPIQFSVIPVQVGNFVLINNRILISF